MRLEVLLSSFREIGLAGPPPGSSVEFTSCADDHRIAGEGSLFVALRGARHDGHVFAAEALSRGATGALIDRPEVAADLAARFPGRAILRASDIRRILGPVASAINGYPSRHLKVAAVTGTNGKTTTAFLLESIFRVAELSPALVGTVETRWPGHSEESAQTTPGAALLQSWLAKAVAAGARSLSIEVSSHALDQYRADGLEVDCAVFTNLTQDHLDYHATLDHYFGSKAGLFTRLLANSPKPSRASVINGDDPYGQKLKAMIPAGNGRVWTFGRAETPGLDVFPVRKELTAQGIVADVQTPSGVLQIRSRLLGEYNLSNLLGALAAGLALGIPAETVVRGLELAPPPPGRLERVDGADSFEILVDYAHTPDALENVLSTLKPLVRGRLLTVFGCGGDRDGTKRPLMAAAAARYSDIVVLTSDNPRTEDPEKILDACEKGFGNFTFLSGSKGYLRIANRREAIQKAVRIAGLGDIVVIAGKGHETYQIIGTRKFPFDDRLEAQTALKLRKEGSR